MEYTELDNKAWELYKLSWTSFTMTKNKDFFVYHKDGYPYSRYYEQAVVELRKEKIQKICSKLEK